jgi:hypothetical protein
LRFGKLVCFWHIFHLLSISLFYHIVSCFASFSIADWYKKYFYREIDGEYVYAMVDKKNVRVVRLPKTSPAMSEMLEISPGYSALT